MDSKYLKIVISILCGIGLLFIATTSYAKYTNTDKSNVTISTEKEFFSHSYSDNSNGYYEFTPSYNGYYAFIVTGGFGGNGNKGRDSDWSARNVSTSKFASQGETGGTGGLIFGISKLTTSDKLYICLGSVGSDATTKYVFPDGGVNATSLVSNTPEGISANKAICYGQKGSNSNTVGYNENGSSGGSGAASVVYLKSNSGNALLAIAGAGGSSAGNDYYMSGNNKQTGKGGAGGTNFSSDSYSSVVTTKSTHSSVFYGYIYNGIDGTNPIGSRKTYGGGGTINGGAAGTGGSTDRSGSAGTNIVSGNGQCSEQKKRSCGGIGGGGFGSGGSGGIYAYPVGGLNTANYDPGGGGGGSSFISDKASISSYNTTTLTKIYDFMHSKTSYTPTGTRQGYVIIMYLGRDTSETLSKLS